MIPTLIPHSLPSPGSQDGHLHVWSVRTGNKIAVLEGNHPNPVACVAFNPKYMMITSACNNAVSRWGGVWLRVGCKGGLGNLTRKKKK